MKLKIVLGIFVPLLIVIVLVILSTSNIGFSEKIETVKTVAANKLFVNYGKGPIDYIPIPARESIEIQTIYLKNDFMSRKYELPRLVVCLNDDKGFKDRENLRVKYSEGETLKGADRFLFEELFFDYNSNKRLTVNMHSNSQKQIKVLVEVTPLKSNNLQKYKEYDSILIVTLKDSNRYGYNSCRNLGSEDIENAVKIAIV